MTLRNKVLKLHDVTVYYRFTVSTFPVKIVIRSSAFVLEYLLQLPIRLSSWDDLGFTNPTLYTIRFFAHWCIVDHRGFGHFAKECKKLKRVKDYEYHKEKMMLCKQESKGIPLSANQSEWLQDTNEELDEQEHEAHYKYMAKIQEVLHAIGDNFGPTYDAEPLEKVHTNDEYNVFTTKRQYIEHPELINDTYVGEQIDSNIILDSSDMCDNDRKDGQKAKETNNERVLLASLIANLKLDVDEDKKIYKQ
nr:hypothetical protein [Tanacetum cinerariifolium]